MTLGAHAPIILGSKHFPDNPEDKGFVEVDTVGVLAAAAGFRVVRDFLAPETAFVVVEANADSTDCFVSLDSPAKCVLPVYMCSKSSERIVGSLPVTEIDSRTCAGCHGIVLACWFQRDNLQRHDRACHTEDMDY